jgi:hypothetical protein
MEWQEQRDGRLEKQANGMFLVLDPYRLNLQVVVTDYHASPTDVDLVELQRIMARPEWQPQRRTGTEEPERVFGFLKRHVCLVLAGVFYWLAALQVCMRRPDGSG